MNKEKNQNGKFSIQSRGRWSIRLNNELLDLVQKGVDSWESIARYLGFSVNVLFGVECNNRNVNNSMIISSILRSMKSNCPFPQFQRKLIRVGSFCFH